MYTQFFRAQAGSGSRAYTASSKSQGPGQDLYIQIFRAPAGSCSGAYTECSKSRAQDEICILKNSGPRQVRGLERIQQARKAGPWAEFVYSNFPGSGRLLFWGVYRKLEEPGPRQNQYTQIFRALAGTWLIAYTAYSKIQDPGSLVIDSLYDKYESSEQQ